MNEILFYILVAAFAVIFTKIFLRYM